MSRRRTLPLAGFRERYSGETALLVASGPTRFDYQDLWQYDHPVIFINDTVRYELLARRETFFFTHHPDKFADLPRRALYFYPTHYIRPDHRNQYIQRPTHTPQIAHDVVVSLTRAEWAYNFHVGLTGFPAWARDRDEIVRRNALVGHTGSITSALHFLWFAGFQRVLLVGCNPHYVETHHHDPRIQKNNNRRGSVFDLPAILENQVRFLEHFQLEPVYLDDYEYWAADVGS